MSSNGFINVPRWTQIVQPGVTLLDLVPYLEERDRKLEDFLSFLSQDPVTGNTVFTSPLPGQYFYFSTPTSFVYTVEASYNYKSYNRAGLNYNETNFVAEDLSDPALTLHNATTNTSTVFHHDGNNNQVDVWAQDMSTYRPIKASAFTVSSSRATKTDIRPLDGGLPDLEPVRFVRDGKEHVGLIAEDVQAVFPEASDGSGVDYAQIVAALVGEVQALKARIIDLETGSVMGESDRG